MVDLCDTCKHMQSFSGRRSFAYRNVFINQSGNNNMFCRAGYIERLDMNDGGITYCSSYNKKEE